MITKLERDFHKIWLLTISNLLLARCTSRGGHCRACCCMILVRTLQDRWKPRPLKGTLHTSAASEAEPFSESHRSSTPDKDLCLVYINQNIVLILLGKVEVEVI